MLVVSFVKVGVIRRPSGVIYAFAGSVVVQSKVPVLIEDLVSVGQNH